MPGVILVDDEASARQGLARLLRSHPDVQVLGEAGSVAAAIGLLRQFTPDAVFLDVELPLQSGFELLRSLPAATRVIFVTAHAEHAPLAFEVEALDYLLKPVRAARLALALDRLRRVRAESATNGAVPVEPPLGAKDHLCLNSGGRTFIVPVRQILALHAEGDFTRFQIEGQPSVLMGYNLGRYEAMLPQPAFVRLSRSLIVQITRVESLTAESRDAWRLQLRGATEPIELRRVAAARLKSLLGPPPVTRFTE